MYAEAETITFTIDAKEEGQRVDKVAAARLEGVSRSAIKRWILDGRVELDGVSVLPKTRVREGAELELTPAPPEVPDLVPQDIPIDFLFEDEHLALINKPAGLVVHPAPGHPDGTLVNALLHHFSLRDDRDEASETEKRCATRTTSSNRTRAEEPRIERAEPEKSFVVPPRNLFEAKPRRTISRVRPGIVHRLDKDTSGVMVIAKSAQAHEGLVNLFSAHDIERAYTAIVWGRFEGNRTFDTYHGRHPRDRKKFTSKGDRGRRAITHVETLEQLGSATLVRCTLETGRTHQIRVHLSEHGFPLVGDPMYGRPPKDEALRTIGKELARQALHAKLLGFAHPITNEPVIAEAEHPIDMEQVRSRLLLVRDNKRS